MQQIWNLRLFFKGFIIKNQEETESVHRNWQLSWVLMREIRACKIPIVPYQTNFSVEINRFSFNV
jgi:hypothetical protein